MTTRFFDRAAAGGRLAEVLERYRGEDVLVLGIPRGGIVTAAEVARRLGAELDAAVACKLPAPGHPELAIGAVTADGGRYVNDALIDGLTVTAAYLAAETARQQAVAQAREEWLRGGQPVPRIAGRVVIVVDDGIATGATMRAALRSVRSHAPACLIAAVPVGARDACDALTAEADVVVCLSQPEPFVAVGLHYEQFATTSDGEVRELIAAARAERLATQRADTVR